MQLFKGRVKAYDPQTGKGSIAPEGGGDDVSVDSRSSGERLLSEGQKVSFRMIHRPDGVYACDIKLI
ncbi:MULTISPECIES: cold-shock protein [unclassified Pseudomonas]|jgi:CspA family cold shock protein|uniref:cold-shock protein n=1 Tax=unclassified Pseudomonas TaxID=196821 RepID=UPI00069E6756|nr:MULTISPECIES: cold shock domain-containing protein [unclassified Pseudomonas]MBY8947021.1 cold-shock protein [Pseudomonas sp. SH10-3B]